MKPASYLDLEAEAVKMFGTYSRPDVSVDIGHDSE